MSPNARRRAERDEYQQQLQHAQRLDALGRLAGGIAHDLNNTLVPVLALTKLMLKDPAMAEDDRRNLEVIMSAGERARDLVQQVLTFSRKAPSAARRRFARGNRRFAEMLRVGIDEQHRADRAVETVAAYLADSGQIHQVIVNLVTNAAQAIGDREGNIAVTLDPGR